MQGLVPSGKTSVPRKRTDQGNHGLEDGKGDRVEREQGQHNPHAEEPLEREELTGVAGQVVQWPLGPFSIHGLEAVGRQAKQHEGQEYVEIPES